MAGLGFVRRESSDDCACSEVPAPDPYDLAAGQFKRRHDAGALRLAIGWAPFRDRPVELAIADVIARTEVRRLQHYLAATVGVRWRL